MESDTSSPERAGREGDTQPLPAPGKKDVSAPAQQFLQTISETQNTTSVSKRIAEDLEARIQLGVKRYGQRLQTHNGRSMLQDAYEEALDLYHYVYGSLLEDLDSGEHTRALGLSWLLVANASHLLFQLREALDAQA